MLVFAYRMVSVVKVPFKGANVGIDALMIHLGYRDRFIFVPKELLLNSARF